MKNKTVIVKKKAVIVAGGPVNKELLGKELDEGYDLLVAADGGGDFLYRNGYTPHILLGDFDSLPAEMRMRFEARGVEVIQFPKEKNWTDLELAVDLAVRRGAVELGIHGALGGRLDHTLANLGLLVKAERMGVQAILTGVRERVYLVGPGGELILYPGEGVFFSVLPLSPGVKGLSIAGAKFPLHKIEMEYGSTRGIHNEFTDLLTPVKISLGEGFVYVILSSEKSPTIK